MISRVELTAQEEVAKWASMKAMLDQHPSSLVALVDQQRRIADLCKPALDFTNIGLPLSQKLAQWQAKEQRISEFLERERRISEFAWESLHAAAEAFRPRFNRFKAELRRLPGWAKQVIRHLPLSFMGEPTPWKLRAKLWALYRWLCSLNPRLEAAQREQRRRNRRSLFWQWIRDGIVGRVENRGSPGPLDYIGATQPRRGPPAEGNRFAFTPALTGGSM